MEDGSFLPADVNRFILDSFIGRITAEWTEISEELVSCLRAVGTVTKPFRRGSKPKIEEWSRQLHPFFTNVKTRALFEKTVSELKVSLEIRNIVCHEVLRCRTTSAGHIKVYRRLTSGEPASPETKLPRSYNPNRYAHLFGRNIKAVSLDNIGHSHLFCMLHELDYHAYKMVRTLRHRVERFSYLARGCHRVLHQAPASPRAMAIQQDLELKNSSRAGSAGGNAPDTTGQSLPSPAPSDTEQRKPDEDDGLKVRHAKTLNRRRKKRK